MAKMRKPKPRNKQPDFVRKAGPMRDRTKYTRKGRKPRLDNQGEMIWECTPNCY